MRSVFSCGYLCAVVGSFGVMIAAPPAWADDLKEAEKLYGAAAKDMAAGNYARACPTFEAAKEKALEHVRTGMTLAQCYTEWGKPGSAYEELKRVREFAVKQNKTDKVKAIDNQLANLKTKAPLLLINVPTEAKNQSGLAILSNGKPIPVAQWDTAVPVNPGTYRIEASASGKEAWQTSVDAKEPGKTITVKIAPPSWGLSGSSNPSEPPAEPAPQKPTNSKLRTLGFVGLGIGGAGIVVGSILGGLAISKNKAGAEFCTTQNACSREGYDLRLDAYDFGNASTVALIVGGVLASSGVLLIALAPSKKDSTNTGSSLHVQPWVGPASFGLRGTW